jgi:hypothetical protein
MSVLRLQRDGTADLPKKNEAILADRLIGVKQLIEKRVALRLLSF